jgi:Thioredoxin-like
MAEVEEAKLAAEIARLEAELERARVHAASADSVQYHEFSDESYEEEYIEEEYIEEEYYEEEIVEEEYEEENEVAKVPEQAPARPVFGNLQQAQSSLSASSNPSAQLHEPSTSISGESAKKNLPISKPSKEAPKINSAPIGKTKVRPPPNQGGKPMPPQEPVEAAKATKKFPLSRLFQQNKNAVVDEANENGFTMNNDGTTSKKIVVSKPGVPKKPTPKASAPISPPAVTANPSVSSSTGNAGTMKRRIIPNKQPSPAGKETIFEQLLGPKLISSINLHKNTTNGCVQDQELIALYFGAKWKSDCKRFNPILKKFYMYAAQQQQNFEVVYISADRSLIEFKDCFATMPYLAMPAGTTELKNELTKAFKIIEMPALVILDDEGNVVSVQGVQKILELDQSNDAVFAEQVGQLIDRWKKTRPIPIEEVKRDNTLLHGTIERGTVYWQN